MDESHQSSWRAKFINYVMAGAVFVIMGRLVHLQVICNETFAAKANRQQTSQERIPARPGDILDRHGRLLATTITLPSLYANPKRIFETVEDPQSLAERLAFELRLDADDLKDRLQRYRDKQFMWIVRQLTSEQVRSVEELTVPKGCLGFRHEHRRFYPQQHLAAHVLGLRNIDGKGRGGLEQWFDALLSGQDGMRQFVRDARGNVLDILEEVTIPPEDGTSIVTSLDIILQHDVESQLDALVAQHKPKGACAIVLDPRSGEVLAMASRPTFDPNELAEVPPESWKNHAIASVFEPGSTFKPMVVSWALSKEKIEKDEMLNCEYGGYRMGPRILHDHHPYGRLSLTDVLVKSSNIGMAKIGQRLGNPELHQLAQAFGFGNRTGVELPGELSGLLRPVSEWTIYSTGSVPMGQEFSATPLQVLTAHAVLANGGQRVSPHFLIGTAKAEQRARDARMPSDVVVTSVVDTEAADWVVQTPMTQVVERGTGTRGKLPGIAVFGKTGTAQKVDPKTGKYSRSKNVCSFVCGAPAGRPRALVLVSVDEPTGPDQFGGTVAAPTASRILERALDLVSE